MKIKAVYMDDVAEKIENINIELYNNLPVVMGLSNIEGFTKVDNDYLLFIDSEENYLKIKEIYPQYYNFIIAELKDFNSFISSYDGGDYYKTSIGYEVSIGDCIDILIEKMENNNPEITDILDKYFNSSFYNNKSEDIFSDLIKQQITDVIELKIKELQDEILTIKEQGLTWR